MERQDYTMPTLLQYENVAWYEDGKVQILDRRIYPRKMSFVECVTYQEVAQAITDMVTQSAGPYTAAGMGMALASYQSMDLTNAERVAYLEKASETIATARPTTANRMRLITEKCVQVASEALNNDEDPTEAIKQNTIDSLNRRYSTMNSVAKYLIDKIPENGAVLTQCFGETIIGMLLREAIEQHKNIRFFCAETRPYLQGARLTASCCAEMGFETTIISDNMTAYLLSSQKIDLFTSAADSISLDGHIANKVGTYQIALLANYFGVPYFVTGIPDYDKKDHNDIKIEMRNPEQVMKLNGIRHTLDGVKAIYPSFDITPPELIGAIVTDNGFYSPYDLTSYFKGEVKNDFY
ncbi:methylthioribose-1-phosphate isomerase [Enterococcus avium]|uniref:S-methyl-5-thioribose-1-phosphate isomerase n=1 Tax=Enterococcus TaxID=1350 RepID=UPI00159B5B95|nr:S-methyl-5-thioribose-1-phosphate isomerase [Enterococcus devriesei]MBU5366722.1 S-methyl-5-thioribose-1-phosphate isomerase [Enterococcus devriesei]BBM18421.1 methylthioribose-1-phosphate isomerase [Enterococcus avium]